MKKIIDGKLYNTETARKVDEAWGGDGFRRFEETLYCKKTGEYFLYGKGGPMTKYAHSEGQNSWSGGDKFIPLSYKAAQEWAEQWMDADDYEKEFGPVSEGDDRVSLNVSLSAGDAAQLKRMAQEKDMTVSAYLSQLIRSTAQT